MSTFQKAERKQVIVDTDDMKDSNHTEVTGKIPSLGLDSSMPKMQRKCKAIR